MIRPAQFSDVGWKELDPFVSKLNAAPGAIVIVAIEFPETQNFPRVSMGFFNVEARKRLRRALKGEKRQLIKETKT